jgi:hypothetical protein
MSDSRARRPVHHTFSRAISSSSSSSSLSSSPIYLAGLSIPEHISLSLDDLHKQYHHYRTHTATSSLSSQIRFIPDSFFHFSRQPLFTSFIYSIAQYLSVFLEYLQCIQTQLYEIRLHQAIAWNPSHLLLFDSSFELSTNSSSSTKGSIEEIQEINNKLSYSNEFHTIQSRLLQCLSELSHQYTSIILYPRSLVFTPSLPPTPVPIPPSHELAFYECLYSIIHLTMDRIFYEIIKQSENQKIKLKVSMNSNHLSCNEQSNNNNSSPRGNYKGEEEKRLSDDNRSVSSSSLHSTLSSSLPSPRPIHLSVSIPQPSSNGAISRPVPMSNSSPSHLHSYPPSIPPIPLPVIDLPPLRYSHLQWELDRLFRSPNFQPTFQWNKIKKENHNRKANGNGWNEDSLDLSLSSSNHSTPLDPDDPYLRYLSSIPLVPSQPFVSHYANYPGPTLLRSFMTLRSPLLCATLPAQKVLIRDNKKYALGTFAPKPPQGGYSAHKTMRTKKIISISNLSNNGKEEKKEFNEKDKLPAIDERGDEKVPKLNLQPFTNHDSHQTASQSFRAAASSRLSGVTDRLDRLNSRSLTARTSLSDMNSTSRSVPSFEERLKSSRPIVKIRGRSIQLNDETSEN